MREADLDSFLKAVGFLLFFFINISHTSFAQEEKKDKLCDGIGIGNLKNVLSVNASNIHEFENCTKVHGDIIILELAAAGDRYTKTPKLDPETLGVFKDLREITGFLHIQWWPENLTELTPFRNLETIRGRSKQHGRYSLVLVTLPVKSLGLRSLKEISDGNVIIKTNKDLCYVNSIKWTKMFRTNQQIKIENNKNLQTCVEEGNVCDPLCSDEGCWGPGPFYCFSCRNFTRNGECVESCNILSKDPREYVSEGACYPCHTECMPQNNSETCSGPGPDNCNKCAHYSDVVSGCVKSCPTGIHEKTDTLIYKYPDESRVCQVCHPECKMGCRGPGAKNCLLVLESVDDSAKNNIKASPDQDM